MTLHDYARQPTIWGEGRARDAGASRLCLPLASQGVGCPALSVTALKGFEIDTDFGFGHAAMVMPKTDARHSSGFMRIARKPGDDGSWIVGAFAWPQLATALESDEYLSPSRRSTLACGRGSGAANRCLPVPWTELLPLPMTIHFLAFLLDLAPARNRWSIDLDNDLLPVPVQSWRRLVPFRSRAQRRSPKHRRRLP
ncbi:hypothetical protein PR202_ga23923 [Eleusine coracana subsp. coracana]|uniref:Uncharacterized protein n=1 Tax=Eleusine coracana subsp. coracana TaxID=191504 RepID=A0AAV5D7T7_ELECO|nr:hypothetical protein PR202_ga23923 [Eleusine coracana subsp. coracana]